MNNMFDNYDFIPDSYIPDNTHPSKKYVHNKAQRPMEEYNAKGQFVGYTWNYGDSIILEFCTEGNVTYEDDEFFEDAETYLQGKIFKLRIYDFRYEVIYQTEAPAGTLVKFLIDSTISDRFLKGVYYCSLSLIDDVEYTLINASDCKLIIK